MLNKCTFSCLQGYEGSLLKVTSKNGKTASVSLLLLMSPFVWLKCSPESRFQTFFNRLWAPNLFLVNCWLEILPRQHPKTNVCQTTLFISIFMHLSHHNIAACWFCDISHTCRCWSSKTGFTGTKKTLPIWYFTPIH